MDIPKNWPFPAVQNTSWCWGLVSDLCHLQFLALLDWLGAFVRLRLFFRPNHSAVFVCLVWLLFALVIKEMLYSVFWSPFATATTTFWFWLSHAFTKLLAIKLVLWCKDDIPFLSLIPCQPWKSFGLLIPGLLGPEEHSHPAHSVSKWEKAGTFPAPLLHSDKLWHVSVGLSHFRLWKMDLSV